MLDSKAIGLRVAEIRTGLDLTRSNFGNKVGVQGDVIRSIEDNRNKKVNEPLLTAIDDFLIELANNINIKKEC